MSADGAITLFEPEQFFAPAPRDALDGLLGRYEKMRARVEDIAAIMTDDRKMAVRYFQQGNTREDRQMPFPDVLFKLEGGIAALNADFWRRALDLTDIYDCMPQARRDQWNKQIREMSTPDFTEDNIRSTLGDLLAARPKFLAERVDGIFRGLSGDHVTNSPSAFGKRMILAYVFSDYGSPHDTKAGLISDLRAVIAKFMGREAPRWGISHNMLRQCMERSGEWHELDGGALRIRVYKKGTAHLEVHPDMAWRLNAILHTLYPHAIPPAQRQRPPKATKTFRMIGRPLPFAVLDVIQAGRLDGNDLTWNYFSEDQQAFVDEAMRALESVGGVREQRLRVTFDYDPRDVIRELVLSGCLPDVKAHQYYPTPELIARAAVEMARVGPEDVVLEPSAGTGHIADLLPRGRTTCVEIAPLHCKVLTGKGYSPWCRDFLDYARGGAHFDRIVMNPPYSEGRWLAHLRAAADLLNANGRLVAVLPASARGKSLLDGYTHEWGQIYENEFAGASVNVTLLALERAA
jgi:hypothetical protein